MKDISQRMMHSPDSDVLGRYQGEKSKQELENEVRLLRERLASAQQTLTDMGHQMELQKTRTRQLLAGWKIKLEESEDKVMTQAQEKDQQFTDLISDLMYFEGCLKRERQEIVAKLGDRDRRIRELERQVSRQEKQIHALNRANEKLLSSLHAERDDVDARAMSDEDRDHGKSSDETEESSSSHDNSSEAEQSQMSSASSSTTTTSPPSIIISSSRRSNGRRSTVHTAPMMSMTTAMSTVHDTVHHKNNNNIKTTNYQQPPNNRHSPQPSNSNHHHLNNTHPLMQPNSIQHHQHRVRFVDDDVVHDLASSRPRRGFLKMEDRSRARKISLPAYRLPITNEEGDEKIRFC